MQYLQWLRRCREWLSRCRLPTCFKRRKLVKLNEQLPWFLICGDNGVGKSSFIESTSTAQSIHNEEMPPVYVDTQHLFIEIPCVEKPLDAIRMPRLRTTSCLRGVIVVIDVNMLISLSDHDIQRQATRWALHIQQWQRRVRCTLPIVVVFNKADALGSLAVSAAYHPLHSESNALWLSLCQQRRQAILQARTMSDCADVIKIQQVYLKMRESAKLFCQALEPLNVCGFAFWNKHSKGLLLASITEIVSSQFLNMPQQKARMQRRRYYAVVALATLTLLSSASLLRAFHNSRKQLHRIQHAIQDNRGDALLWLSAQIWQEPRQMYWGLSRNAVLRDAYYRYLQRQFSQSLWLRLSESLATELHDDYQQWQQHPAQRENIRGGYYLSFKAYRILFCKHHQDAQTQAAVLAFYVAKILQVGPEQLSTVIQAWLQAHPKQRILVHSQPQRNLLQQAQETLQTSFDSRNVYESDKLLRDITRHQVNITQLLSAINTPWYNDKAFTYFYTRDAQQHILQYSLDAWTQQAQDDTWLFNDFNPLRRKSLAQLKKQLKQLYNTDHQHAWQQWLQRMELTSTNEVGLAFEQLQLFSQNDKPWQALCHMLKQQLPKNVIQLCYQSAFWSRYQRWLHAVVRQVDAMQAHDDEQKFAIRYMKQFLQHPTQSEITTFEHQVQHQLHRLHLNRRWYVVWWHLLTTPTRAYVNALKKQINSSVLTMWQQDVVEGFQQRAAKAFPNAVAGIDLSLDEFMEWYQPRKGILAKFYHQNIKPFTSRHWLPKAFVADVERLLQRSSHYFLHSQTPQMTFQLMIKPTPGVKHIAFTHGDCHIDYRNHPEEWLECRWQPLHGSQQAALRVVDTNNKELLRLHFDGVWSLWHLLQNADAITLQHQILWARWHKAHRDIYIGFKTKDYAENAVKLLLTQAIQPLAH